jgi:hypothetical protein
MLSHLFSYLIKTNNIFLKMFSRFNKIEVGKRLTQFLPKTSPGPPAFGLFKRHPIIPLLFTL